MTVFIIKPVVWNTLQYLRPSGARFTSGYPKDNGFGHEEWNNSVRYRYSEGGQRRRVFHTEQVDHPLLVTRRATAVVFMVASHQGKQYVVAVAGEADYLRHDRAERNRLIELLGLRSDGRREEAWNVPQVAAAWSHDLSAFRAAWRKEHHWTPSWSCPDDLYLALPVPVLIDPPKLTGKARVTNRYSAYQLIDQTIAREILSGMKDVENPVLDRLRLCVVAGDQDVDVDVSKIEISKLATTTKLALIEARLGQGTFRSDVLSRWNNRCSVTGCAVAEALQACHVKPWKDSNTKERLSADNALLLTANLHHLFDASLIWFEADGSMGISDRISVADRALLGVGGRLREGPNTTLAGYLAHHRDARIVRESAVTG